MGRLPVLLLFACFAYSWAKKCDEIVAEEIDDEAITSWCGVVDEDWTGELIVAFDTDGEYNRAVEDLKSQFPGDFAGGSPDRLGSLHAFVASLSAEHVRFLFDDGCDGGGLEYVECNRIYRVPETFGPDGRPIRVGNHDGGTVPVALSTLCLLCLANLFAFLH
ncbi:hypothetical protein BSKO_04749 [Bryopsis sp. KO-2023]|nr:hypothetical protein BSKO_04749 [Bryopsis sp. KO-2023]